MKRPQSNFSQLAQKIYEAIGEEWEIKVYFTFTIKLLADILKVFMKKTSEVLEKFMEAT